MSIDLSSVPIEEMWDEMKKRNDCGILRLSKKSKDTDEAVAVQNVTYSSWFGEILTARSLILPMADDLRDEVHTMVATAGE